MQERKNITHRLLFLSLVGCILSGVMFSTYLYEGYTVVKKLIVELFIILGLVSIVFRKRIYFSTPILILLIFIGLNLILLFKTPYKFHGQEQIHLIITHLLLLFLSTNLDRKKRLLIFIALGIFGIVSLIGILQYTNIIPVNWEAIHWEKGFGKRVFSTIGNPNALASYLIILLPLTLILSISKDWRFVFLFFPGFICILFTNSWSGWMGLIGGTIAAFISIYKNKVKINKKPLLYVTVFSFCIIFIFATTKRKKIFGEPTGRIARFLLWETAVNMIKDKPFGFGPGGFFVYSNNYLSKVEMKSTYDKLWLANPNFILRNPGRPHNEYLNLLVETGILGFAIFGWLIIVLVSSIIRKIQSSKGENKLIYIGILSNIIGILVQSITDFPLRWYGSSVLFFLLLGIGMEKREVSHRILKPIIIMVSIFMLFKSIRYFMSNVYFTKAQVLQKKNEPKEALKYYKKSLNFGIFSHLVYSNMGSISYKLNQLEDGISYYKKSLSIQPFHEVLHFSIGQIYIQQGALESADSSLRLAISLEPRYGTAYSLLGALHRKRGNFREAEKILKQGIKYSYESGVYNELGVLYNIIGKRKKAICAFIKGILLTPYNSCIWYNLWATKNDTTINLVDIFNYDWLTKNFKKAAYSFKNRDLYSADSIYSIILERYPNYPDALIGIAKLESSRDLKARLLKKSFQIAPLTRKTLSPMIQRKDVEESMRAFEMANKFYKANNLIKAQKYLLKAIDLNPLNSIVYYNLGVLLSEKKDYLGAIEAWERFILLSPYSKDTPKIRAEIVKLSKFISKNLVDKE